MKYNEVRGFNYQPSYAHDGKQVWEKFDLETYKRELGWGKKYFPNFNTVRIWLSWNQWIENPEDSMHKYEIAFELAAVRHDLYSGVRQHRLL